MILSFLAIVRTDKLKLLFQYESKTPNRLWWINENTKQKNKQEYGKDFKRFRQIIKDEIWNIWSLGYVNHTSERTRKL